MIKIRMGVFETNSSSSHSFAIIDAEDEQKWKDGFYVCFNNHFLGLKSRDEIVDAIFDTSSELGEELRDVINATMAGYAILKEEDGKIMMFDSETENTVKEDAKNEYIDGIFKDLYIVNRDLILSGSYPYDDSTEIYDSLQGPSGKYYILIGYYKFL